MGKAGRIYDNVHGYINLDEGEFDLVTSPTFQRLHWIKQLGPLHIVFPSAQHSRFSHSLGVFHIVEKMIKHLKKTEKVGLPNKISESQEKKLRFAALLHDVGHVPLSHVGEKVLENTYVVGEDRKHLDVFDKTKPMDWKKLFEPWVGPSSDLHECLSAQIVLHDEEIDKALAKTVRDKNSRKIMKEDIAKIILGIAADDKSPFSVLLHSELDADRLDWLLRDSSFTGVGYGHIELDYIISRLGVITDEEGQAHLCVEDKGLHAVEHYLLSRFFLRRQVVCHRRVRLVDLLFKEVMEYLTVERNGNGRIPDLREIVNCIKDASSVDEKKRREMVHKFYGFTDALIINAMRQLHDELDKIVRTRTDCGPQLTGEEKRQEYINDCIKMIMDGEIPEPVEKTHQRLVAVAKDVSKSYAWEMEQEAKRIARQVAGELEISELRIKADVR